MSYPLSFFQLEARELGCMLPCQSVLDQVYLWGNRNSRALLALHKLRSATPEAPDQPAKENYRYELLELRAQLDGEGPQTRSKAPEGSEPSLSVDPWSPRGLVFYYCVTSCHKRRNSKQLQGTISSFCRSEVLSLM